MERRQREDLDRHITGDFGQDQDQAEDYPSQEDLILDFYRRNPTKAMTPSHVHAFLFARTMTPLTSIRRAITDLTEVGQLEKTDRKRAGLYGKDEHCWRYALGRHIQKGLF